MKVQSVSFLNSINNIPNKQSQNSTHINYGSMPDTFVKNSSPILTSPATSTKPLSFMGYSVYVVDGGVHSDNMNHFAKSVSDNKWDIHNKYVDTNYKNPNLKQMESLEWKLKELNSPNGLIEDNYHKGTYVAIPILASVPFQNLEAQMNAVMGTHTILNQQNIRTKKNEVIEFLKRIYENPNQYREFINYMDPNGQGLEKTYGVIYQINELMKKPNTKVYIAAGHPEYASIKWLTEQRNLKPELYNYISTGEDKNNVINNLRKEIEGNGWYDFNLLNLSDANVVNLKDKTGEEDYIYSAYDSSIKSGERGVYNFSPIRDENGNLKGYGYHDTKTVDYPFEEFPANDEVQDIARFVGRPLKEVLADEEITQNFKDAIWNNQSREPFRDKLFKVSDIFPQNERDYNKMDLKGDYIDSNLQLYFRENGNGEVIYPNCDCEGSGRPSVLSMWGSCFSIFNAIKKDVETHERYMERGYFDEETLYSKHPKEIKELLKESQELIKSGKTNDAEHVLQYAVDLERVAGLHGYKPLEALGDLYTKKGDLKKAEQCYNSALNELSSNMLEKLKINGVQHSIAECDKNKFIFENLQQKNIEYINKKQDYDNMNYVQKIFTTEPQKPESAEPYRVYVKINDMVHEASRLYKKLADNCEARGEDYSRFACNWASGILSSPCSVGQEIIERRADNDPYLGDFLHVE